MLKKVMLFVLMLSCNSAFAFITVIDVEQMNGNIVTVDSEDDLNFKDLSGLSLSYRGDADEAIALFKGIASLELPKQLTEYEFETNATTGTISVIIKSQGFAGISYTYFVIKKSGI
jgi:uncharacterized protein YdeI (BOF family)